MYIMLNYINSRFSDHLRGALPHVCDLLNLGEKF